MRILLYNPDNGVTRDFMPHLFWLSVYSEKGRVRSYSLCTVSIAGNVEKQQMNCRFAPVPRAVEPRIASHVRSK